MIRAGRLCEEAFMTAFIQVSARLRGWVIQRLASSTKSLQGNSSRGGAINSLPSCDSLEALAHLRLGLASFFFRGGSTGLQGGRNLTFQTCKDPFKKPSESLHKRCKDCCATEVAVPLGFRLETFILCSSNQHSCLHPAWSTSFTVSHLQLWNDTHECNLQSAKNLPSAVPSCQRQSVIGQLQLCPRQGLSMWIHRQNSNWMAYRHQWTFTGWWHSPCITMSLCDSCDIRWEPLIAIDKYR